MKKLIALLLLPLAALADTPVELLNANTGSYLNFNIAGSGSNIPSAGTGVLNDCVKFGSTTGSLIDAGAACATVTSFTAGNLSPLFTTSVANGTSTPSLTFSLSNAPAASFFGNIGGSATAPSYISFSSVPLSSFGGGTGLTGYLYGNGSGNWTASTTIPTSALSGTLQAAQEPAHTGDVSNTAGSLNLTLSTVLTAGGPVGSGTSVPVITYDAKGRLTAVSSASITPSGIGAVASVTNSDGTITVSGTSTNPVVSRAALTGDATAAAGSNSLTLATVLSSPGSYNTVTVNGKGLVTAGGNVAYLTGNQTITASGDCTGSGTTSLALTCTKTNGTAFAPSATTDTTNAANISSGTLPTARTAAITGDVTKAAGSAAATVTAINGTNLSGLATGILKNATGTGIPSIAVAGTDYAAPNSNTTGNAATATALAANPTDCSSNQYATTIDQFGNLTCSTVAVGQVTGAVSSVTGTAPIVSSGGTSPAISISPATSLAAGSLAAADKAFLNAYENATIVLATSNAYSNIACNGSTDDTSAWNTLVTNVPDRSIIQIPGCTSLLISGNISEPAGKHLSFVGSGSGKTIIQSNNNASDFITVGDWYNTFQGITFQGLNTTAPTATALSSTATTLTVASTAGFPASGSFYVQTNLGWTLASYTSISSGTVFAGVTAATSTTVAGGPVTVKTGGYAINDGTNTHSYLRDIQFNYVYNGWLNNGTQCGILDSSGFGTVNYDLQFNGANVNAIVHNYTADGIPPAVAHIEVEQAGSLLISDSDIIRAQSNMRLNPTSPNGVFGVYAVNTYFDTAAAVSGTTSSGNGVLLTGNGNIQRLKIINSWLSSAAHDGFWCNSTATTLPTDIELDNDNIYSNAANGVDLSACQDVQIHGGQIAGNATAGINLTAATGGVTKAFVHAARIGPTGGIGANGTGIIAATGTYGALEIRGNDLVGNTTAAATLGTITVANWAQYAITDNPGVNPKGTVTTPTFPASTTVVTNTTGYRVSILEKNAATAPTVFTVNGVAVTAAASTLVTTGVNFFSLDPGGTIAFTYTTAPTAWVWYAN